MIYPYMYYGDIDPKRLVIVLIILAAIVGGIYWHEEVPHLKEGDCVRAIDDDLTPQVFKIVKIGKNVYFLTPGHSYTHAKYWSTKFARITNDFRQVECSL